LLSSRIAGLFAFALVASVAVPGVVLAQEGSTHVEALDDFFGPDVIRIPVGGTLVWGNGGRNPHTVTADDGSFDSGNLAPDDDFQLTFEIERAVPYYCRYHGAPGGVGMSGVILVGDAALPGRTTEVGPGREEPPVAPGVTIRVPDDAATIQEAVDRSQPGDVVLVSPGMYEEAVRVTTPFITIRGTDRNTVILDGGFELPNGIQVIDADGVAVENMTARHYLLNGFYWSGVFGYRGSYLTAYNNGDYGLYAFDSAYGRFDNSYASGHPDAGFYIGQCRPCHAVITDVVAENNGVGYSGTNASGDLFIVNSEWRNNMGGIVPNSLDSELLPPQQDAVIAGNYVHDNNNRDAPAKDVQFVVFGVGIAVAGGQGNLVTQNLVEDHETAGIVVAPLPDKNIWITERNEVTDNVVRRSGRADLALGAPAGPRDCFAGNDFRSSLPPAIQTFYGCGVRLNALGGGDLAITVTALGRFAEVEDGDFPHGDWRTQPQPPDQPSLPGAESAPPRPAIPEEAVPGPVTIRDMRQVAVGDGDGNEVNQEVTVLGIPLAASWWQLLLGVYIYVLPLILYAAWVSIAMWDLVRREDLTNRRRIGWMAAVLLVPLAGPVAYYVGARSPIAASLRAFLVAGGLGIYVVLAVIGYAIGST
jgi:plastocyanin